MSKIREGLDKAIAHQVQNIVRQNPKGSSAEQILLGRFLGSDQGTYARNVLGKNHKGWIDHITWWLKMYQPKLQKEFTEVDFTDLESLAYDMYENYLAKQGQLGEGEVVSLQARKTPLVIAGNPYDWDIYDLRTNKMVANILGGDRHDKPLYEIRINSNGMTRSTRMLPTYVLKAGPNNNPPYKAYELEAPSEVDKIEKSPGPGGTTKLKPDTMDVFMHMATQTAKGRYYGYNLILVEEGLDQYEIIEKALGAKIMEIDDAMELGYTDWNEDDGSGYPIIYLGNQKKEGYSAGAAGGAGLGEEVDENLLTTYGDQWGMDEGKAETRVELDKDIQDFLSKGGKIEKLPPNRVRAKPGMGLASKHIGTSGEVARKVRSRFLLGKGRNLTGIKPEVKIEGAEAKMVNANDPRSDGWRWISTKPSGILEGILAEYDTKTIDSVVARLPKGLTVNNFTSPAFKEFLYQKYSAPMKAGWDKLWPFFSKEYKEKHGIKEYKQNPYQILSGDSDFFDNMLMVIPKGLSTSELYTQAFKEFLYNKFADKEWTDFKKNRYAYWDAYEKMGGSKPQGMFNKLKSKIGLEEDAYTDSLYKEFLDSEYNKDQGSYIDTLRNLGQFIRSKGMPEEKAKPIIRRLVAKLHPSGINEDEMALAELKCWTGYKRVPGTKAGEKGSCTKAESAIMKGLQTDENINEYELDSSRKIEFNKENPPAFDYLYRQFIHNMLSSAGNINPQDWINAANNRYGLSYTYKDYQNFGKNRDNTGGWDKFIKKYILNK